MDRLEATVLAFDNARVRASIAQHAEAQLLHMAVYDAREAGLSVREAARVLRVPKSTVARHWRPGHFHPTSLPEWGTPEEYVAAQRAIWSHSPAEAGERVPYVWEDLPDGRRVVRAHPLGTARKLP